MRKILLPLFIPLLLVGVIGACGGCYQDPYIPPTPPVPPVPPNPDPPIPPDPTTDPTQPPTDLPRYGEDVWSQIVVGMTEDEVFAVMPKWWLRRDNDLGTQYVYVTTETHENGYPKLFTVRFRKEGGVLKVYETSGRPF